MSPRHCAVFAPRSTAVGAEVCCLDIISCPLGIQLPRCMLGTGVRLIDFHYNSNLIVLSCFTCFTCRNLTEIIGFIGHAIISNLVLCALNILIF